MKGVVQMCFCGCAGVFGLNACFMHKSGKVSESAQKCGTLSCKHSENVCIAHYLYKADLWINCNILYNGQYVYIERGCILPWKDLHWLYIKYLKYKCLYWNTACKGFMNLPQNFCSEFSLLINMQFYYWQCHLLCLCFLYIYIFYKMQFCSVNCTNGDVSVNTFF